MFDAQFQSDGVFPMVFSASKDGADVEIGAGMDLYDAGTTKFHTRGCLRAGVLYYAVLTSWCTWLGTLTFKMGNLLHRKKEDVLKV